MPQKHPVDKRRYSFIIIHATPELISVISYTVHYVLIIISYLSTYVPSFYYLRQGVLRVQGKSNIPPLCLIS